MRVAFVALCMLVAGCDRFGDSGTAAAPPPPPATPPIRLTCANDAEPDLKSFMFEIDPDKGHARVKNNNQADWDDYYNAALTGSGAAWGAKTTNMQLVSVQPDQIYIAEQQAAIDSEGQQGQFVPYVEFHIDRKASQMTYQGVVYPCTEGLAAKS